jgi:hypothetical protein
MTKWSKQHRHSLADKIIAAHMAGAGATANEIAQAIGRGMTPAHVYDLLQRIGVRMVPKARTQTSFPLVIDQGAMEALATLAAKKNVDPRWFTARLVEACLTSRPIVDQLMQWIETP